MAKYANPARAGGICDRCGFAYKLSELSKEYVRGRSNGLLVCPDCWDDDHPQNYVGLRDVTDAQSLRNPRPENSRESRRINWYSPGFVAGRMVTRVGNVNVETA